MKMDMIAIVIFALIGELSSRSGCSGMEKGATCESPQYLELKQSGIIQCVSHDAFFGVLWYDTTEYSNVKPVVHYQNHKKTGTGYETGEYDVHQNGSLVIREVTLKHEHVFRVAYLYFDENEPLFLDVDIVVIVKSAVPYPVYDKCRHFTNKCFATTENSDPLRCSVRSVRPKVSLTLVIRTTGGDQVIENGSSIVDGEGFTASVEAQNIFHYSNFFVLIVCKAVGPPEILENYESLILAEKSNFKVPLEVKTLYIEWHSPMELSCTTDSNTFIVWKKVSSLNDQTHELLLYSITTGEHFTDVLASDVSTGPKNTLRRTSTDLKHEGIYFCAFGGGEKEGLIIHNVSVFVFPVPAYPVIGGCDGQQYCTLIGKNIGVLTCSLTGIRPVARLEWKLLDEKNVDFFTFKSHHNAVKRKGDLNDVTLTSTYFVSEGFRDIVSLECRVMNTEHIFITLKTRLKILFEGGEPSVPVEPTFTPSILMLITIVVISMLLVYGLIKLVKSTLSRLRTVTRHKYKYTGLFPSFLDSESRKLKRLKRQFLRELKGKYRDLYKSVQPIPYIKDRQVSVESVFVEGGIVFCDSIGGGQKWSELKSYRDMFDNETVKSSRQILEGEPGFGKSTVALQIVSDWCKSKSDSVLKKKEVLIFLRLRQLSGVPSIYRAIKRFLLSKDSNISEDDIGKILESVKTESVVLLLDGFDEYPDRHSSTITDIMTIIAGQKFQDFQVITATRTSVLPKKYSPSTKKIRLTGFDDNARREYIRKAVVGDDDARVNDLEEKLNKNAILNDLCQVPLLFVVFAHMTYEKEDFRNLNSVTSFFRLMISCFHSHMRNKMKDENVRKYKLFEHDHETLDKVAFDALSTNEQKIVWKKRELYEILGGEFYEMYLRTGILIEEEICEINDDPSTSMADHVQYITEARFYHKLFCEWYAAHYLADFINKYPNVDLKDFLRHLNPFDVQYLYRFSCGLNKTSAEKIIHYLRGIEGGDKFAILCILEKSGNIDNIRKAVRQLCDDGVVISGQDNLLLQRSSMQLLEIAARNNIQIEVVEINNCLQSIDLSAGLIEITSGLTFSSQIPVKRLHLSLYDKRITADEANNVLRFANMCPSLCRLWFQGNPPPRRFTDKSVLSCLEKKKNVKVKYFGMTGKSTIYELNLETGLWEKEDDDLRTDDFQWEG